ncbi:hypothetical protein QX201_13692 [Fusarium graminearum]
MSALSLVSLLGSHTLTGDTVQATGSAPRSKELSPINNHLLQLGLRPWLLIFHGSGSLAN